MSLISIWVDASNPLSGAALAKAGFPGCFRYGGIGSGPKRLTVAERDDLHAHGRVVYAFIESTTTRADSGYAGGVADGRAALADPALAGIPYLIDTCDKPTFVQADVDYTAGFRSVVAERAGSYGFAGFLKAVRAQTPVALYVQAGEPPNLTGTQSFVHFWQRQGTRGDGSDGPATPTTITIGGVNCDLENQLLPVGGMMSDFDTQVQVKDSNGNVITQVSYGWMLENLYSKSFWAGGVPPWDGPSMYQLMKDASAKLDSLSALVASDHAAELAALSTAIKGLPAPVVQQINADPAAVAANLESSGLPGEIVNALMALLAKAAPAPTAT